MYQYTEYTVLSTLYLGCCHVDTDSQSLMRLPIWHYNYCQTSMKILPSVQKNNVPLTDHMNEKVCCNDSRLLSGNSQLYSTFSQQHKRNYWCMKLGPMHEYLLNLGKINVPVWLSKIVWLTSTQVHMYFTDYLYHEFISRMLWLNF